MNDKKLTDKEIVKALECCVNGECPNCPLSHNNTGVYNERCGENLMQNALDLINRQKTEIQAQRETIHNRKAEVNRLNSKIRSLKSENERLKGLTFEFSGHNDPVGEKGDCGRAKDCHHITEGKAEAYKEFAERLEPLKKLRSCMATSEYELSVTMREVDNLLKELGVNRYVEYIIFYGI